VGGGGGASVLAADDLDAAGLKLPRLLPETLDALAKVTQEAGTSIRNPIDTTSLWQEGGFEATLTPCVMAPNADAVLYHTSFGGNWPGSNDMHARMINETTILKRLRDETGKPIVVAIRQAMNASGLAQSQEFINLCSKNKIATCPTIARAGVALARLIEWQEMHQ